MMKTLHKLDYLKKSCVLSLFSFSLDFFLTFLFSHKPYFYDCLYEIFLFILLFIFFIIIAGPINCLWSGYGEWSRCSVSCGTGTQQRKRMILQKAKNGGSECNGDPIETRSCSQPRCPGTLLFFSPVIIILNCIFCLACNLYTEN